MADNFVRSTVVHGTNILIDHEDIVHILYQIINIIKSWERIMNLPDCNMCGRDGCRFMPEPGQMVRFNCPLWVDPKGEKNG